MMDKTIVKLNVGGIVYATTYDTLRGSVYLATLVEGDWDEKTHDEIFIDRDGFLFRFILLYLRTGEFEIEKHYLKSLKNEAEYYGIPDMSVKIDQIINTKEETVYQLLTKDELNNYSKHTIDPFSGANYNKFIGTTNLQFISSIECHRKVYHCPRNIFVHTDYNRCGRKCDKFPVNVNYEPYTYESVTFFLVRSNVKSDNV